jgi:3-deoxy-D-manno-octulosonate cytidylyltransferase
MKILGIIPSRLKSTRLPNKPLYEVDGRPLIEHVFKRARLCAALTDLIVATDDEKIANVVKQAGGSAMMTSPAHRNGTERMAEVMRSHKADYYVLINGDEILLNPNSIETSVNALIRSDADASILAVKFTRENSPSDFKIVLNAKNEVMYISRNDIPSSARNPVTHRLKAYHLMTFKPETLDAYVSMDKSPLEKIEDHEHLRLIENGYRITCSVVDDRCISLDTIDDLPLIKEYLSTDPVYSMIK